MPRHCTAPTGLYSQLAKYNLPYPEAVFHISYFRNISAKPFYQLAKVRPEPCVNPA
jgi:NAD-dependent SIR2 family protein deacetylase